MITKILIYLTGYVVMVVMLLFSMHNQDRLQNTSDFRMCFIVPATLLISVRLIMVALNGLDDREDSDL